MIALDKIVKKAIEPKDELEQKRMEIEQKKKRADCCCSLKNEQPDQVWGVDSRPQHGGVFQPMYQKLDQHEWNDVNQQWEVKVD